MLLGAVVAYKAADEITSRFRIGFNETESLSNWGYVIDRDKRSVSRGDLIEFSVPDNPYYPKGASFVKRAAGVPGDLIEHREGELFINGQPSGRVKAHDRSGKSVEAGPTGEVPQGHVFVLGDHKDSLDSRYSLIGFIPQARVRGVGSPIL